MIFQAFLLAARDGRLESFVDAQVPSEEGAFANQALGPQGDEGVESLRQVGR